MIRSLYVRIVLTFMAVVAVGLTLSFIITKSVYDGELLQQKQSEMLEVGGVILPRLEKQSYPNMASYLDDLSALGTYHYTLVREGQSELPGDSPAWRARVDQVLVGGEYRSKGATWLAVPEEVVVGMPFQAGGIRYGLFIALNFKEVSRSFSMVFDIFRSVTIVKLLIGSLLILLASGYLVRPIKKLTDATKKIAAGQYDVELKVKQRDELGVLSDSFNHMARQLQQLERMRQNFVSDVSHELQSPLTSIRGFSTALAQDDLSPAERTRCASVITAETERLSRLCEDLLKLASLESENHPYTPVRYRLDEQLRRTIIAAEPMWSSKQIDLDLSLEEATVNADPDQMAQVWNNLFTNSIKFTPAGGRIGVTLKQKPQGVAVTISDSGIGIPSQDIERIFERFYKVDQARDRSAGGSGLGLAIVRKIVDIHNGRILVLSEPNKGTAITITLPEFARGESDEQSNSTEAREDLGSSRWPNRRFS
jgi:signal transduction histidine kinase